MPSPWAASRLLATAGAFGLEDDCALIAPAPAPSWWSRPIRGEGVHFLADEDAGAIAWKALAVNVSDLVAKAARPLGYLMALPFPRPRRPAGSRDLPPVSKPRRRPSAAICWVATRTGGPVH